MTRRLSPWLAGAAALAGLLAACSLPTAAPHPEGRQTLNFNPAWKFLRDDPGPAAADPGFDDRGWTTVSTPHTYNDADSFDHWSVPGHRGEQGTWGGVTWYRKTFTAPADWAGRSRRT